MDGGLYRNAGGRLLAGVVIVGCVCVALGFALRGCL